jgi:hypothetical protein
VSGNEIMKKMSATKAKTSLRPSLLRRTASGWHGGLTIAASGEAVTGNAASHCASPASGQRVATRFGSRLPRRRATPSPR